MALHDAEGRRQSQSASREPGREERVEDVFGCVLVHAVARVRDLDEDVGATLEVGAMDHCIELRSVARHDAGLQRDDAPVRVERLGCVRDQIDQDLADLDGIGCDRR